ncbi:MAG TPA: DinB family protein [Longimicrobium sp.]
MSTESPAAPSLKRVALGDLEHELANNRAVLERVPDDKLDWKPHPRSFSLGQLAIHVARLPFWITSTLQNDFFDLAGITHNAPAASRQDLLDAFDQTAAEMRAAMEAADDAALMRMWELRMGDRVLQRMPKIAVVRGFGISHFIHHRGQLTVYLRLLEVPLPPLYGPTADEQPSFG